MFEAWIFNDATNIAFEMMTEWYDAFRIIGFVCWESTGH